MSEYTLYRCTECGNVYLSLGDVHAHIERHRPWWQFWRVGGAKFLLPRTEVVTVEEAGVESYLSHVEPDDVALTSSDVLRCDCGDPMTVEDGVLGSVIVRCPNEDGCGSEGVRTPTHRLLSHLKRLLARWVV